MRVMWEIIGIGPDPIPPETVPVTYIRDGADWPPLLRMPMIGELITIEHTVTFDERPYRRVIKDTFRVVREGFYIDTVPSDDTFWKITLEKADDAKA